MNKKIKYPVESDGPYTPEEIQELQNARAQLQLAQETARWARHHWNAYSRDTKGHGGPQRHPLRLLRTLARRAVREANHRYRDAVLPRRMRLTRVGKMMGEFIKDRLTQESFMEKILPVVEKE